MNITKYIPFIEKLHNAYKDRSLVLVCGAGVSEDAGLPNWDRLLLLLLTEMINGSSQESSNQPSTDIDEFNKYYRSSEIILAKRLKSHFKKDFIKVIRNALYSEDIKDSHLIKSIVELARTQRDASTLNSIITFNFDDLLEKSLKNKEIPHKPIFENGKRCTPKEIPIYHVHGYIPRKGKLPKNKDIVFAEDSYHRRYLEPFSWSNLTQLNMFDSKVCLFIGTSLNDPNLRRLLDVARNRNDGNIKNHFILKKRKKGSSKVIQFANDFFEDDANELGLNVIWIDEYHEVPYVLDAVRTMLNLDVKIKKLTVAQRKIVPGETITISFKIKNNQKFRFNAWLGASLISAEEESSIPEIYNLDQDLETVIEKGTNNIERKLTIPEDTPNCELKLLGAVWTTERKGSTLPADSDQLAIEECQTHIYVEQHKLND